MAARKQTITLRFNGGGTKDTEAEVYGTCAVHQEDFSKMWRVTHVPSGARIIDVGTLARARKVAKALGHHPKFDASLKWTKRSTPELKAAGAVLRSTLDSIR